MMEWSTVVIFSGSRALPGEREETGGCRQVEDMLQLGLCSLGSQGWGLGLRLPATHPSLDASQHLFLYPNLPLNPVLPGNCLFPLGNLRALPSKSTEERAHALALVPTIHPHG